MDSITIGMDLGDKINFVCVLDKTANAENPQPRRLYTSNNFLFFMTENEE